MNGNDAIEILKKSKKIVEEIRLNKQPQFILLDTYRILEHCGPNNDDNLNYRNPKEITYWKKKCPIRKIEKILISKKILNETEIRRVKSKYSEKINIIFETCKKKKIFWNTIKKNKIICLKKELLLQVKQ